MALDNLNYEELKQLSDEEKKNVLEELQRKYGSNMEIAKHLGVVPIVISNLIKKYVTNEPIGRTKKPPFVIEEETKSIMQEEKPQESIPETKPKRQYIRKPKETTVFMKEEEKVIEVKMEEVKTRKFVVELNDEYEGSEAKEKLSGLAGVISLNKKYEIEVTIKEV